MTVNDIIEIVCMESNTTFENALTESRETNYVMVRHRLAYFLYNYRLEINLTLKGIGAIIGKDHSTVIHSHHKITDIIEYEKAERELIRRIERKLNPPKEEIILIDEIRKITACCWDDDTKEKLTQLLYKYDKGVFNNQI